MPPVLQRAHDDLQRHEFWRARHRLEGFVGSKGYQAEVIELLGTVCHQMGDLPAAGRFWFFTIANTDDKKNAIALFVRQHRGQPQQIYSQLPRRLRDHRWSAYPPEVRERLQKLQPKKNAPGPGQKPLKPMSAHWTLGDRVVQLVGFVLILFLLFCFLLGVRQVIAALQKFF